MRVRTFTSILDAVQMLQSESPPTSLDESGAFEWVDYTDFYDWSEEWVDAANNLPRGRIIPTLFSPYLYRGQVQRYTHCYPKIYRGFPPFKRPRELSQEFRTRFLVSHMKVMWFASLVSKHPAISYAHKIGLQIDPVVLAQHYGLETPYLDFTQLIDVAAFFASCRFENNQWTPVSEGEGIIYRLAFAKIPESFKFIELVGLSTFPRPKQQYAWAARLTPAVDFEELPYVDAVVFKHTEEGSRHFYDLFNRGLILYPPDLTAKLAEAVSTSPRIPTDFVAKTLLHYGCRIEQLQEMFERYKKLLVQYHNLAIENDMDISFSDAELVQLNQEVDILSKDFLRHVGVRPAIAVKKGEWLTKRETITLLQISKNEVDRLIDTDALHSIRVSKKIDSKRPKTLVSRRSIDAYIARRNETAANKQNTDAPFVDKAL